MIEVTPLLLAVIPELVEERLIQLVLFGGGEMLELSLEFRIDATLSQKTHYMVIHVLQKNTKTSVTKRF